MGTSHKDFDLEYMVENFAQRRYFTKANELDYATLKDIAEEELIWFMEHKEDTLRDARKRFLFRCQHHITFIRWSDLKKWDEWRENGHIVYLYEHKRNLNERW